MFHKASMLLKSLIAWVATLPEKMTRLYARHMGLSVRHGRPSQQHRSLLGRREGRLRHYVPLSPIPRAVIALTGKMDRSARL